VSKRTTTDGRRYFSKIWLIVAHSGSLRLIGVTWSRLGVAFESLWSQKCDSVFGSVNLGLISFFCKRIRKNCDSSEWQVAVAVSITLRMCFYEGGGAYRRESHKVSQSPAKCHKEMQTLANSLHYIFKEQAGLASTFTNQAPSCTFSSGGIIS
jgi:hypothetical protein